MLHVVVGGRASSLYRHPVRESRIWGTVYTGYPLRGYIGYTGYTGYTVYGYIAPSPLSEICSVATVFVVALFVALLE